MLGRASQVRVLPDSNGFECCQKDSTAVFQFLINFSTNFLNLI